MDFKNYRIISVALTGSWPTKKDNPNVPITPEEIGEDIYQCWKAGASIAHIHVRDVNGKPSMDPYLFEKVVNIVKSYKDCDIILNFTTSGGVQWNDEQRMEAVKKLKPEMASYDCGSMNWQHRMIFKNSPDFLKTLALTLSENNIKPEIEIFDSGMINEAKYYLKIGVLKSPLHFQMCLGVPGGADATVKELIHLKELLPADSTWSAFGIGRGSMEILYGSIALGGHVRVGMEDNIKFSKNRLASGNVQFVKRARKAIELYGLKPATPSIAREILGLNNTSL